MKASALLILCLFFAINSFCQIVFESGYFIDSTAKRIDCLIKNKDRENNPLSFEYKLNESDNIKIAKIGKVIEFGITGDSKFIAARVKIDTTKDDDVNFLDNDMNPFWKEDLVFLKVITEGEAVLYAYKRGSLKRYFYSVAGSPIEQLVYKKYLTSDNNSVAENTAYLQQLRQKLYCNNDSKGLSSPVEYKQSSLKKYFEQYNICKGGASAGTTYDKKKKDLFNLKIAPRVDFLSLSINNVAYSQRDVDFGSKTSPSLGVELEFILPFYKNKWSIIAEPTYYYFKEDGTNTRGKVSCNAKGIELAMGLRYYFFLNAQSKIFVNAAYMPSFGSKTTIDFEENGTEDLESKAAGSFSFGGGYAYKRWSIEARYHTTKQLLGEYSFWNTDFNKVSIIIGFSFF